MNYPFQEQTQKSYHQEKDIEYDSVIEYLCLNSSDRDVVGYPSVNNYRIFFDQNFRNISSIEIVSGSIANQGTPLANPYLIVKVDGLDHLNFSNINVNKGFALLYLKPTSGAHVQPELGVLQRNVRHFDPPLASLNSLNIQIVKPDGTPFVFGESGGDVTVAYSNSFVFKITTKVKSRDSLRSRNVY